jgi:hypothetical protein
VSEENCCAQQLVNKRIVSVFLFFFEWKHTHISVCLSLNHTFYQTVSVCLLYVLCPTCLFLRHPLSEFYICSMIVWHIRIVYKLFYPLHHHHHHHHHQHHHNHHPNPCNFLKVRINYYSCYIGTTKVHKSSEPVNLEYWERCYLSICIYFSESSEDEGSVVDLEPPRKRMRTAFAVDGTGIRYSEYPG